LGLYPSFASFALTHGLLLFFLNDFKHENAFFILGDDVVILDPQLYDRYRTALTHLNCPVSESKTIQSDKLAEFAGKLILEDEVVDQFKWRDVSDDSFMDFVRNIGPKALALLRPRQRKVANAFWTVPDLFGGLGFNPEGKPLEERVYSFLSKFGHNKERSYLMSHNKLMSRFLYEQDPKLIPGEISLSQEDFDQKSIGIVSQHLPSFVNWYEIVGKNLFSINPSLDCRIEGSVGRMTRLQQLEALL